MDPDTRPATKSDLADLETRMKAHLEGRMDVQEQRILERMGGMIRDSETRLLQAFYGFAEATNKRLNQVDGNIAIF